MEVSSFPMSQMNSEFSMQHFPSDQYYAMILSEKL